MTKVWQDRRNAIISRRTGTQWLIVGLLGCAAERVRPATAKRRKRKHKPKPKPPLLTLEQCRSACGENCDCLAAPNGDLLCGAIADADCEAPCQSGSDCAEGTCIAVFLPAGGNTVQRFDCDYRAGLCADIVSCIG